MSEAHLEGDVCSCLRSNAFLNDLIDLPCQEVVLTHVDVLAVGRGVVTGDGFAEALRAVHPRPMDEEGVEEDGVPSLHLQVGSWGSLVKLEDAVVHLVHSTLGGGGGGLS